MRPPLLYPHVCLTSCDVLPLLSCFTSSFAFAVSSLPLFLLFASAALMISPLFAIKQQSHHAAFLSTAALTTYCSAKLVLAILQLDYLSHLTMANAAVMPHDLYLIRRFPL